MMTAKLLFKLSRLTEMEPLIRDLKNRIASLEELIRNRKEVSGQARTEPEIQAEAVIQMEAVPPPPPPEALKGVAATSEDSRDGQKMPETVQAPYAAVPPPPPVNPPLVLLSQGQGQRNTPKEPSWLSERFAALIKWLIGEGNIWVSVGVLLFLAGFGLLFSYAVQRGWFPLEFRLAGASAVGIAMTAFGWRMRDKRRTYALILQGGGIGVLYIVLLAGVKLEPILPVGASVIGMLALSAFTAVLALFQDYEPLAMFALLGGYAAPVLLSSGSSNFVALFSIHSLLNLEILTISLFRDWRKTRWLGLFASIAVGLAWGLLRWRESYFASVEPFLILFFLNYSAIALIPMLPAKLTAAFKPSLANYERIDMPMIATIPFILVFLQMYIASHTRYGVALTCLAVGLWYLALGTFAMRNAGGDNEGFNGIKYPHRLFLAYCIVFSSLAIPFVFAQASAASIWGAEGAVLVAYAARRRNPGAFACGLLLHVSAFVIYNFAPYLHLPQRLYEPDAFSVTTGLLFAVSSLVSSYFSARLSEKPFDTEFAEIRGTLLRTPTPGASAWGFAAYGTAWWVLAASDAPNALGLTAVPPFFLLCIGGLAGFALSSPSEFGLGGLEETETPLASLAHFKWQASRLLALPPVAAGCFFAVSGALRRWGYFYSYGSLFDKIYHGMTQNFPLNWLAFALMFLGILAVYRKETAWYIRRAFWGCLVFSFVAYSSVALSASFMHLFPDWGRAGGIGYLARFLPVFAAVLAFTAKRFRGEIIGMEFISPALLALAVSMFLSLWDFMSCFASRGGWITLYIPLLNSLELWQALYIASAAMLIDSALRGQARRIGLLFVIPAVTFFWLNSIAARAALHYFGETVRWGRMTGAPYFQGLLAMLWGFTALALIYCGKRYGSRVPWFMGAALLALDIAKLLLVDLSNAATVIRIFAFLLLGGFFLLIGWIAPLPPKIAVLNETPDEAGE
jgi:uncharacterized membrane protein